MTYLAKRLVGKSQAMAAIRSYLPKLAQSAATVLITGETGTGKERIARALHELSPRRGGPFVAINCAAMPEGLAETELFGHQRGAFTGATATVPGHFVVARGGTLFLDEIGEMSPSVQAKILRVLENHEVLPVGARQATPVDVRIAVATNRSLAKLVESGSFRADLFYRLSVAHIHLPSLKERREDIPLLFEAFRDEMNQRYQHSAGPPDEGLVHCLLSYDWPGNIRELRNLIEAIFIDPPTGPIGVEHLPPVFRQMFESYQSSSMAERDQLLDALRKTKWNKAEAAKLLKWSRMTLYRKLAKYKIERPM